MFDLTNKKALITGSTQGIGKAIALCLAEFGAEVIVNGSSTSSLEKCRIVADQIIQNGGKAAYAISDLSQAGCAKIMYEQTGDIDILVLNASVQFRKAWNEITEAEFDTQVRVNFKSSLELIQIYEPSMSKNKWGRIVTVGSVQQYKPHKDMLVYAGTKQAQMSMVKNLAKQFAPSGITVNNMSPGVIDTPRNEKALSDMEYTRKIVEGIPCGYIGKPEDCCGAVLLLCSNEGRYITGTDIIVDGGMSL